MRKSYGGVFLFASLALLALAVPIGAQTETRSTVMPAAPRYEASKEVTLQGNVLSMVTRPAAGMLVGAHVMVAVPSGDVDGHLGVYATKGTNAFSVTPGERVSMVGVMSTANGKRVFLVRTIEANGQTYRIRNEHGALIHPALKKTSISPSAKGGVL